MLDSSEELHYTFFLQEPRLALERVRSQELMKNHKILEELAMEIATT